MKKIILALGLMGLAFSGYLSSVKLFTKTCGFKETCQIFLGYPACYYGFVMYLLIVVFAVLAIWKAEEEKKNLDRLLGISSLGLVFAGYFTAIELPGLLQNGMSAYTLGLPTCMLGFIFYIFIFTFTFLARKQVLAEK